MTCSIATSSPSHLADSGMIRYSAQPEATRRPASSPISDRASCERCANFFPWSPAIFMSGCCCSRSETKKSLEIVSVIKW